MKYENILSKNKKKNMAITKKREVTKSNPVQKTKIYLETHSFFQIN